MTNQFDLPPLPPLPVQSPDLPAGTDPIRQTAPYGSSHAAAGSSRASMPMSPKYGVPTPANATERIAPLSTPAAPLHPPQLPMYADVRMQSPVMYRRGRGSTRAPREQFAARVRPNAATAPGTFGPATTRPAQSGLRQSNTPWGAIIATAAITALVVSAANAMLDRAFAPAPAEASVPEAPAQVISEQDWTVAAASAGESVVSIKLRDGNQTSQGSGVVWDTDGHIVTNHHVIELATVTDATEITVLVDNQSFTAELVGSDAATDLAVLKVNGLPDQVVPMPQGDSEKVQIGENVMAIGSPLGLHDSFTTGIVSALDRPVTTGKTEGNSVVTNAIQTSAPLNPGNSGGALVNHRGELIGINSSIATVGGAKSGSIGIGFAIPQQLVTQVANELIKDGKVAHAWLGISTVDGAAADGSGTRVGAEVRSIEPTGPSSGVGIQPGDVIIRVGDTEISGASQLVGEVRTYLAGDEVTVEYLRDGKTHTVDVTLGESPTLN